MLLKKLICKLLGHRKFKDYYCYSNNTIYVYCNLCAKTIFWLKFPNGVLYNDVKKTNL